MKLRESVCESLFGKAFISLVHPGVDLADWLTEMYYVSFAKNRKR